MIYRFWKYFGPLSTMLWLLLATVGNAWLGRAAEEGSGFAGTYRDERITVEVDRPTQAGDSAIYTGNIQLGEQRFPFTAEAQEQQLKGTFENQGDQFPFSASVVGKMLVLTTDGTTYRLRKQSPNPLARAPSKPNPLTQAVRTNAAVAASPPPTSPAPQSSTGANASSALRFRRHSLMDTNTIGGEAFHCLIPSDWQVEGGLGWRMHPSLPAYLALRVSSPNRVDSLETFPTIPFVWADGGIPLFPPGSNYLGNEVAEPIEDPVVFVQQIILPRFRPLVRAAQIVATEDLSKLADVIRDTMQEPGVQKKVRAARVRLEYVENGKTMQEDIYCVLALTYAPALRATYWGADRNYSFKSEKGKLEARTKIFQTIISSFQPNLEWFNRYVQFVQLLMQSPIDISRPVAELGRFATRTSGEITEGRRQSFERQRVVQERINSCFSLFMRGVDDYRDPSNEHLVQLPAGYQEVWTNPLGDYLLSDDPTLNPNVGLSKDWQRVPKNH